MFKDARALGAAPFEGVTTLKPLIFVCPLPWIPSLLLEQALHFAGCCRWMVRSSPEPCTPEGFKITN